MAKQADQPLVSVIVPVFNVEAYASKCIDSLLSQTYNNIEIIIVNDGSKGDINSITAGYQKKHTNIQLLDLGENRGLFRARLEGFKKARGDYLISVDGDDSISIDYIRTMVTQASQNYSDVVIPETVIESDSAKFIFNLANDLPFDHLSNEQCLDGFYSQQGENFIWHRVAAPMYSRRIFDLAIPYLDEVKEHIIMCEDLLFSAILWNFAIRIDRSPTAYYYYYQHEASSVMNSSAKSLAKRIQDINRVSNTIKGFHRSQKTPPQYEKYFLDWMNLYSLEYHSHIDQLAVDNSQKEELVRLIEFGNAGWKKKIQSRFYSITTTFNSGLENVKQQIKNEQIKVVSFDIFDTLVTRPFLTPSDLFYLLDKDFKSLDKQFRLQDFHDIRIKSETIARSEKSNHEDVSLSQIYSVMQNEFFVKKDVAEAMIKKELAYEARYCFQRAVTKELYDLAMYLGKKIIIASDMYLPVETIEQILYKCDFRHHDKLYVSSDHGTMKATQNLYRHITADLSVEPESILHMGDNYESDVVAAEKAGWVSAYLPKTTEASRDMFSRVFGEDSLYARNHLGVTVAYAMAINRYFDNPYRSFNENSIYNCSPYFMGYFALGLSTLGFTRWMVKDMRTKDIETAVFLSRDGYLPKRLFDIFTNQLSIPMKSYYLPTSRKAIIPLSIFGESSIPDVRTFNYLGHVTKSILASLEPYLKDSSSSGAVDIDFNKIDKLHSAFTKTYRHYFKGRTAVMDIGYSGRPEQILSKLFNAPLETYFIYSGTSEAKRRLGDTVNIYTRLKVAAIREKMISEVGPSCTGYEIIDGKVEPIFEQPKGISYYEKLFVLSVQSGAIDFNSDYLDLFSDHLDELGTGDNRLAMQPLDQATVTPDGLDREMYRGVMHEDGVAVDGSLSIFDEYYGSKEDADTKHVPDELINLRLELATHMGIKRSAKLLAGNIKRRILYGRQR